MKKRQRGRHQAAARRGKPKELSRGDCGSRRKLAAACSKMSRRAAVAWRKRNVSRNICTEKNYGPRQELGAGGIRMTLRAKVTQRKEAELQGHSHEGQSVEQGRKSQTRNKFAEGTQKGRTLRRRQLIRQEGINGNRNRDFEEQPRLKNERTTSDIYRKEVGGCEASSRDFQQITENEELGIVEGSPPSEKEKDPTSAVSVRRAGKVGSPATLERKT